MAALRARHAKTPRARRARPRDRAPALRVLVEVERQRGARRSRRRELLDQLRAVQGEIRRRDHGDGVRTELRSVSRQRAGLRRGLRAAVHDHPQTRSASDRQLGHAGALPDPPAGSLASHAEHQKPVERARGVELEQWRERVLVELRADAASAPEIGSSIIA